MVIITFNLVYAFNVILRFKVYIKLIGYFSCGLQTLEHLIVIYMFIYLEYLLAQYHGQIIDSTE